MADEGVAQEHLQKNSGDGGKPWTELEQTSVNRQCLEVLNALPHIKVQMATIYIHRKGLERLICNDNWSPKKTVTPTSDRFSSFSGQQRVVVYCSRLAENCNLHAPQKICSNP